MTCTLSAPIYNKYCQHCMEQKIINLRATRDPRLARKLQDIMFVYMGSALAYDVRASLRSAK